jgi:two-component system, chemotaxis family, sensor kinase CheA
VNEHEEEFFDLFRDEANERLDRIVDTLLALESDRAGSEAVEELFRDAHTIKGAAGMLGLDDVRALAHAFEDVLAGVRERGSFPSELVEPLLRAADALRRQVAGEVETAADLLDELEARRTEVVGAAVAAAPVSEEDSPHPAAGRERASIRVRAEKLDRLLNLVGETVLHRRRLEHVLAARAPARADPVSDELDFGDRLLDDLKDATTGLRTQPLGSITGGFPRAVRDIAAGEGREVELRVRGAETELDRVILEGLTEPLVHLLRNAVAHGIEPPAERERAGKPRAGLLQLSAEQRGATVSVTVSDDGRGVSPALCAEAERVGSLAEVLTPSGLSTADEVTELAGRGVGLAAVKSHVEAFGGGLEIESEPGAGTRVRLLLPLTLALLEVLLFERAGQAFALPLHAIEELVAVDDTLSLAGRPSLELRGHAVPVFDLADVLGARASALPARPPAIVVSAGGRRAAVLCDRMLGEQEVVVKSLGPLLVSVRGYLGAAILGDGRIALIVDPLPVARAMTTGRAAPAAVKATHAPAKPKVLVVEDAFTVRELQRSILETAGYRVVTARDGNDARKRLAEEQDITLVVTDVEMPNMDGIQLVEAIRADPRTQALPVVVVTSRGGEEDRRRGIDAGADAYMAKRSFDQQALLETVERLIGR